MKPNYMKTENMLANLERIWLDSKFDYTLNLAEFIDRYASTLLEPH